MTHWHRHRLQTPLMGAVIMTHTAEAFAAYLILIPFGQFGVGISGGINYIFHSTLAQLQRYVTPDRGECPTRALLLLDIRNMMFNECSRETCRATLLAAHPKF